MVSQQLVAQWRTRLAAWQQRLEEGRPRPWLARAYVRVLSYLLVQYAPQADTKPSPEAFEATTSRDGEPMSDRSKMKFEAAIPDLIGKPPRSREDIRSVLEAVKAKVPHVEQGPHADGLHPDDPIVAAAFYSPQLAQDLIAMLDREGIESYSKRFRRQIQVMVRAGDLECAKPIVARHAAVARDSSRWRFQYVRVFSRVGCILGMLLGLMIGATVFSGSDACALGITFAMFFGLLMYFIGLIIGTIADG